MSWKTRWKGENVSTLEVSHIICQDPSVLEANVYGVEVPGHDGRAGMASVSMRHGRTFDADALYRQVTESLPRYARPLFVRLMPVIPTTTTFKHQKSELVRQGFDVDVIADPIFLLNDRKKTYSPMDTADLARILAGNSKL
ncbi:long-chain fatty acid transport protein 3-like [Diadema setosum]|uniref:long-chain fatty acid transport protein 3-like n=1 Tax=Diadema setosum TaxID=31175 RepID=UPI003B3B3CAB